MLVALMAKDKPDALQTRLDNREAHVDYLKSSGTVVQAGPFLDEAGQMIGSLIILDVPDMEAARQWCTFDPYTKADLFQSVELIRWNRVIG